jgi:hypothetical protein
MSEPSTESDDTIAEDVLPTAVEEAAVPVPLDILQPWHRPRKQFIRERQWLLRSKWLIQRLLNGRSLRSGITGKPEVNYLTLPGIDYLDVRLLSDACTELGCALTTTGFLAEAEGTPVRARAQFREDSLVKAGRITDRSITLGNRFEEVSSATSQAYYELRGRGPFHIVNVDACGSIAPANATHANRIVDAIYRVVELQLAQCSFPWLLFVTADVRRDAFALETLNQMTEAIIANANENDTFGQQAALILAEDIAQITAAINHAKTDNGLRFVRLFALGLAKWLLHLAAEKLWRVRTHSCFCYSTRPEGDDRPTMPCLAFEFVSPEQGLQDRFGVTRAAPAIGSPKQDYSLRAVTKIGAISDVDETLKNNHQLTLDLIARTRTLLVEAGYTASALTELEHFANLD